MKRDISKDNWVLVLKGNAKIWLSEGEANNVKNGIQRGARFLDIKGGVVGIDTIMFLVHRSTYEESERVRRGDYQCPTCKQWIPRFKTCGWCFV